MSGEYDIIKSEEVWSVFGEYKLPIKTEKIYITPYITKTKTYTESEITAIAAARLSEKRDAVLREAELLKISTNGGFTDDGYYMTSDMVLLCDVGQTRKITD